MRPTGFAALGAGSGLLSAAATLYHLGDVAAPRLFGHCLGIEVSGRCGGVDEAIYLFPGLVFGLIVGAGLVWAGRFDAARAGGFVLVSAIGNALAVFFCVWLFSLFGSLLDIDFLDLPLALAGAVSGGAGGGLLSVAAARLMPPMTAWRPSTVGAVLGLLVPLVTEWEVTGIFIFYLFWQGGYAAALGDALFRTQHATAEQP